MAIDFSKIDIGRDVAEDIKKMTSQPEFYEKVVKEAATLHMMSVKNLSADEKDPAGNPYRTLSKRYGDYKVETVGNRKANLRYSGHAMRSMHIKESSQNRSAELYFTGKPSYSDEDTDTYMNRHQTGRGRAQRPVFAESRHETSAPQMQIHKNVGDVLSRYLNTPRRITIG